MKYIKNIKEFDLEKWWQSFSKKIEKEDLIILFTIFLFGLINYFYFLVFFLNKYN